MDQTDSIKVFDWHRIFYSEDIPISYLAEIGLRTAVMFLTLIIALKFLSKRGVKQLSVFELAILIALGSATGDPMFYHYVPLTYGIIILVIVIVLYRIITRITGKSKLFEVLLEGRPVCLLKEGKIDHINYKKVGLPYDKFFAELRQKSVSHLGQVKKIYLETSGEFSIYMYSDEQVNAGLPIAPELIDNPLENIQTGNDYACIHCGNLQTIETAETACNICEKNKWLSPQTEPRTK